MDIGALFEIKLVHYILWTMHETSCIACTNHRSQKHFFIFLLGSMELFGKSRFSMEQTNIIVVNRYIGSKYITFNADIQIWLLK